MNSEFLDVYVVVRFVLGSSSGFSLCFCASLLHRIVCVFVPLSDVPPIPPFLEGDVRFCGVELLIEVIEPSFVPCGSVFVFIAMRTYTCDPLYCTAAVFCVLSPSRLFFNNISCG